jgi:hypothetical protein
MSRDVVWMSSVEAFEIYGPRARGRRRMELWDNVVTDMPRLPTFFTKCKRARFALKIWVMEVEMCYLRIYVIATVVVRRRLYSVLLLVLCSAFFIALVIKGADV